MELEKGKNSANGGGRIESKERLIEKWEWIERSELVEESKSRVVRVSVVELREELALLRVELLVFRNRVSY